MFDFDLLTGQRRSKLGGLQIAAYYNDGANMWFRKCDDTFRSSLLT